MALVKDPAPEPSAVQESPVSGLADAAQHTPLAVTVAPPSEETLPPEDAVVRVMSVISVVETVGRSARVVNSRSCPYAVPSELVAYARTW
jgi:hypothetical protein